VPRLTFREPRNEQCAREASRRGCILGVGIIAQEGRPLNVFDADPLLFLPQGIHHGRPWIRLVCLGVGSPLLGRCLRQYGVLHAIRGERIFAEPPQEQGPAIPLRLFHDDLSLNEGHLLAGPHVASRGDISDADGERRA
jgi:hypothetical protein